MAWLVGVCVAILVAALMALPHYAPPYVEQWLCDALARQGVGVKAKFSFDYCWRNGPGISGELRVAIPETPWKMLATFAASCCEYTATVVMPETSFDETDALLRPLLERYPLRGVSNLVFSGSVALNADVVRTFRNSMPTWHVKMPISHFSASFFRDGKPVSVDGLGVTPSASGIANHVDANPLFARAKSACFSGFDLTNLYATVRKTERSWVVNEARAGFCGGQVNVYSLYLDPQTLNTGFTLFIDNVDAGQVLAHVGGFRGEASGRLHGKLKAFVKEGGRSVRLREAFLYSTPGETGKLRMENPEVLAENLAYAGLDGATRANVSDALTDLDYRVLRFDLKRLEENAARLTVQIGGSATRGNTTVPVDITVNLNGELEQLINTGLGYSVKMKGKSK